MNKYKFISLVLLVFSVAEINGQLNQKAAYSYPVFNPADENKLLFQIEDHNFFKNNEYFSDYSEGYTLPGYNIEPSLIYYPSSRVRLKVGVHMLKFFGEDSFHDVVPIVSAHAFLTDSLQLILGALRGNVQHNMLEPIYDTEFLYTDPVENGIQFLYANNWFKGDMWLNWEQFIVKGDTIPEILTFGLNTSFRMVDFGNSQLSIPFQFMAHHRGGQISDFEQRMLTLTNGATGLSYEQSLTGFINKIKVNAYYLWFNDVTEKWGLPFIKGWAAYPNVVIESSKMQLMAGYFYGNNYTSSKGSPLFQSVSDYNPDVYRKERNILTAKFLYCLPLAKNVNFTLSADAYYDLNVSQLDYAYSVNLHVNPQFFIAKIPAIR